MEPLINEIKNQFIEITELEVKEFPIVEDLFHKIKLLLPYYNTALEFYMDKLYWLNIEEGNFVVFGHNLGGYFVMDKNDGIILQIRESEKSLKTIFCNSDINKFICFNNLFINWLLKRISNEITKNFTEKYSETLQLILIDIDSQAFCNEDYFWVEPLYEISEDFFPLTDASIKLIEQLQSSGTI